MKSFSTLVRQSLRGSASRGAALIIAILVIVAVSGLTLHFGRAAIQEVSMLTSLEESSAAFYAAEAGIEQGLLMWRYNHSKFINSSVPLYDVEFSNNCQTPTNCTVTPPDSNDGGPVEIKIGSGDNVLKYQLKIWHRNSPGMAEEQELKQDQSIEYNLSGLSGNLYLYCLSGCNNTGIGAYTNSLEYSTINDQINAVESKDLINFSSSSTGIAIPYTNAKKLRLYSWGSDKTYKLTAGTNDKLDSRTTVIESTGFSRSGKIQRKLRIEIDRASGTILPVYDFVLFSKTGITIP